MSLKIIVSLKLIKWKLFKVRILMENNLAIVFSDSVRTFCKYVQITEDNMQLTDQKGNFS